MATGLTDTVRQAAAAGKSREEIIEQIVAGGMSRPTAERFVDKVLAPSVREAAPAPPPASATSAASGDEDDDPRGGLAAGAFWFSLGTTVTAATFLAAAAKGGGQYTVAYGALLGGLFMFGRALAGWWGRDVSFPWIRVGLAGAVPPLGALAIFTFVSIRDASQRRAREEAERQQQEAAARAAKAEADAETARKRRTDKAERMQKWAVYRKQMADEDVARFRKDLRAAHSPTSCRGARGLAEAKAQVAIDDLLSIVGNTKYNNESRGCAANALIAMGQPDPALAFYADLVRTTVPGSFDHRQAVAGLRELGPGAADIALPHIAVYMESPHADVRRFAVWTLAALGPSAEPLLRKAAQDSDKMVREPAERALAALRSP